MKDFTIQFLGTTDVTAFIVSILFALIGLVISLGIGIKNRDKGSRATPRAFSWIFFLKDNALRFITTILILFTAVRFHQELVGQAIDSWKALLLGLCFDQAVVTLKNFTTKARQ